jgi:hypothetical protein
MTVRAKFKVSEITEHAYGDKRMKTIKLQPVYSSKEGSENKTFWEASPNGEIRLGTINMAAADYFELNGEYYIDFLRAE